MPLEAGTIPWQKPWIGSDQPILGIPKNFVTENRYHGEVFAEKRRKF